MITESGKKIIVCGEFERWYIKGDELVVRESLSPFEIKLPVTIIEQIAHGQFLMPNHKGYNKMSMCKVYKIKVYGRMPDELEKFTGKKNGQYFVNRMLKVFQDENVSA